MDQLNRDFLEFIGLLDEEAVDYLIVGGYAVGIHGFPRYTGDIDFFVATSRENADRLIRVFERFGFGDIGLTPSDFLIEDFVVEIGREPRKIQVLTGIDGVLFDECLRNRIEIQHQGRVLKVIGKEDLIRNKAASGRAKDLIDLTELRKL
jgi:predicted nucleotidyltransferase